jgi:iron complex outermembrane receptor protein
MQVRSKHRGLIGASIFAILAAVPAIASAQDQDDLNTLPEIIVTARKVAENVQDVPSSITALSATQLDARGVKSVADLYTVAPNVEFANSGFLFNSLLTIRGVRSSDVFAGFETANGTIVDDVYVGRSAAFNTDLLDIERIEILRGPQGTLQGKNIIGGAINITTVRPGPDFGAGVTVEAGDYNLFAARAYLNAPLSDTVSTRFNLTRRQREGFTKNAFTGNTLGDTDNWGGRAQLSWKPNERLSVLLQGEYSRDDATDAGVIFTAPGELSTPFTAFALKRTVNSDVDSTIERELFGLSAIVNYAINDTLDLTSVTAYRGYNIGQMTEQDGLPVAFVNSSVDQEQRQFSQELRLTYRVPGMTAVGGLYYYRESIKDRTRLYQNIPLYLGVPPIPGLGLVPTDAVSTGDVDTDSVAVFAAITKNLTDQLILSGGLRFTHDQRDNTAAAYSLVDPILGYPAEVPSGQLFTPVSDTTVVPLSVPLGHGSIEDTQVTGDVALTYRFTDDVSTYVKYARGYKGGGFQTGLPTLPGSLGEEIKPEFVDNWEMGLRSTFWGNRARFNVTGFYMNWKDRQSNRVAIVGGIPTYVLYNDPKAVLYGIEAEFDIVPVKGVTLGATYGFNHAEFEKSIDPSLDGKEIAGVSPNNLTFSADWVVPLGDSFNLRLNGNARWADSYQTSDGGAFTQPSYWWLNAAIGVETADGRYRLRVWGRNLTDEDVVTNTTAGIPTPGSAPFTPGASRILVNFREPRTAGLEFSARF